MKRPTLLSLLQALLQMLCLCTLQAAPNSELATPAAATAELPAFVGAEGFGACTPGGRGGAVFIVSTLEDSGPGSFREACEASGPRTIVFEVAGTISLKRKIIIRNPYLTVAGQSAPGDGICLRGYTLGVATHDVVLRYLRSRLGDETGQEDDCIVLLKTARNCVIDHCSATWSTDECLSLSGEVQNCTIQWCLIGESLNNSLHKKGAHAYGSLARANGPITFHHNLWLHNDQRSPRLGDNYNKGPDYPTFDVRNNVIYDFGEVASGLTQGVLKINYIGNILIPGPSSQASTPITVGTPSQIEICIQDNFLQGNESLTHDNALFFDHTVVDGRREVSLRSTPWPAPAITTLPCAEALPVILASVGASRPVRDSVDARLIHEVETRTGHIINSQKEVGGWPLLKAGITPVDTDRDGMPDAWERTHGLDPENPHDGNQDKDQDGYTNLEEFLNGTDPQVFVDYRRA